MKKALLLLLVCIMYIASYAQAPQSFNYQAVVRDASGNALA
jgi:hypothetical protein